ncbi:PLP-dependent aminotransferase family protein [Acinetobacter puyangensis]|uniref:DNA-binding transcriptional regulator, MocR family, contains an aminotransferase domain n=1 Tax=Acinetobacter puyangensis TaxID=1096779 RepID=A0A240E8Q0_9GAMM|nr:PLP-dependent aminotransferase family protein [Acinetobacter puyangensis]SNX44891.1 DNA-binding transcriptional regulator, MocR family, contains an aminotransferase domain [Acinetobacter puyangensis]
MFKAEQLAQTLHQLIEQGVWKPHQKLPSLREQAQTSGYSLMTVLNAYQELEARGLVFAREKSGYYVADQNMQPTALDRIEDSTLQSNIQMNSFVFDYLKSIQPTNILPFGSAFPNTALLHQPKLLQIVAQHARRKQSYESSASMPPGLLTLQQIIARRYSLQGIATEPQDIVITSGCLDALNLSLQAVAKPGDYILLQQTIFYGTWQAAERLGLNVITLPEHPEYGFDLEKFEQCLQMYPIKVCWLMLNSHNPIGFSVNDDIKQKIAQLLAHYQVYLIEDDVYQELYFGSKKPLSVKYFDQDHRVLHCSSFSKTLGAGFRVGWVHHRKLSNQIQHLQLMSTIAVSPLLQHALVDFLSTHHYEKHLRSLRLQLERHKKLFYRYLKQHLPEECDVYYYPSGYFIWIKLPKHIDSTQLYQTLLTHHIGIAPSQLFTVNRQQQHFIRLNCSFELNDQTQHSLATIIQTITHPS